MLTKNEAIDFEKFDKVMSGLPGASSFAAREDYRSYKSIPWPQKVGGGRRQGLAGPYQGPGFRRAAAMPSHSVIPSESEGANATKDESRNPENASLTMRIQGVLSRIEWHSRPQLCWSLRLRYN